MFNKDELRIIKLALDDHLEAAREMANDLKASKEDRESNKGYYLDVFALANKVHIALTLEN